MLIQPSKRTPVNYPRPFVQFSSKPVFIVSSTQRPGIQTDNNGDSLNTETSNHGVHTEKNSYSVHTENSSGESENTSDYVHKEVDMSLYRE